MLTNFQVYLLLCIELLMILLYGFFTDWHLTLESVTTYYKQWMDVHVMIFVGFGFLMVFLKRHAWSSVSFNFFAAAFAFQIFIPIAGMWSQIFCREAHCDRLKLDMVMMFRADFAAGAVLISMGVLLGKVTGFQLIAMSIVEIFFYGLNEYLCYMKLGLGDAGGSNTIHLFGATFGLAVSKVYSRKDSATSKNLKDAYYNNLIAMVGTLFLWMYWPSFNSGVVPAGP